MREPGASPGRSRRCEGRRSRAEVPLAHGPGRRRRREPRVRRPASRPQTRTPRGRRIRVQASLHLRRRPRDGAARRPRGPRPARARARGGQDADDLRLDRADAVGRRRTRSTRSTRPASAGEFYYHVTTTSFGPYVDQIGRYVAGGSSGWVFKVNGVSPPVGADQVTLKDGDRVLWYWATFGPTGGPPTLSLRAGPKRNCYRVLAQDDTGKTTRRARRAAARRRPQRPRPHRLGLRRRPPRARDAPRSRARSARTRSGETSRSRGGSRCRAGRLWLVVLDEPGRRRDALGDARPRRPRALLDHACPPASRCCRRSTAWRR